MYVIDRYRLGQAISKFSYTFGFLELIEVLLSYKPYYTYEIGSSTILFSKVLLSLQNLLQASIIDSYCVPAFVQLQLHDIRNRKV